MQKVEKEIKNKKKGQKMRCSSRKIRRKIKWKHKGITGFDFL